MKEIAAQYSKGKLAPLHEEDIEKLNSFKENQPLRLKIIGFKKPRSVSQLGTFMACCKLVADNTEDAQWNTKDKVKFQAKVLLHFVDDSVVAVKNDGTVVFQYRSLSFDNLEHMEACRFFDRGYEVLASKLGISVEKLICEAQKLMVRND